MQSTPFLYSIIPYSTILSTKHIILIGFKNTGKSTVGRALAQELNLPFTDLDKQIEKTYAKKNGKKKSCRSIMKSHGEKYFRQLEHYTLKKILKKPKNKKNDDATIVLAVGGGTPMLAVNRKLLREHIIVQISAPQNIVFERIIKSGTPAFFQKDKESFESFQKLWNKREPIFKKLANITIKNNGSLEKAVDELKKKLKGQIP